MRVIKTKVDHSKSPKQQAYMAGIEAGNAGMTANDAHYRSRLFDEYKDEFLRGYHEAVHEGRNNPRAYHGAGQETVFVAKANRDMRNWESIGTWITDDIEHAKMFGTHVYQVEYPETLKMFRVEDPDQLTEPFITPGLLPSCTLVSRPDKVILRASFVEAPRAHPFYGKRCYERVNFLFQQTQRRFHKSDDSWGLERWRKDNKVTMEFTNAIYKTLSQAREVCYKLSHSPEYINYLYDYYTSKGYDGLMWEKTAMDAGLHGVGSEHRQTQYLIFHPEKYIFSKVAS